MLLVTFANLMRHHYAVQRQQHHMVVSLLTGRRLMICWWTVLLLLVVGCETVRAPPPTSVSMGSSSETATTTTTTMRTPWFYHSPVSLRLLGPVVRHEAVTPSPPQHDDNDSRLLFWSSFDFSLDAALQSVGPIHDVLQQQQQLQDKNQEGEGVPPHNQSLFGSPTDRTPEETNASLFRAHESAVLSPIPRGGANLFGGGSAHRPYTFRLYQKGDGSDQDPNGIPTRYLAMHQGNRDLAKQSLAATLTWRQDNAIDEILARPHAQFDRAKAVCPHYFLGRDDAHNVIFLQRPALMDFARAKTLGLTHDDMLRHYIYVNEYLWQVLEGNKPLGTMTSILDLTGLQISILRRRDLVAFLKTFVQTMDAHFPQRAHKTLLVNAPHWVNALYKLCAPLMRESTKAKIEIHSVGRKQDEALRKYLPLTVQQQLPDSFWSKNKKNKKKHGGKGKEQEQDEAIDNNNKRTKKAKVAPESAVFTSKLEDDLRAFVVARLKDANTKMLPVPPTK